MTDIRIRTEGRAGCITLARPQALNALTGQMCQAINAALALWADDPAVQIVIIDAEGPRAFCSGGDIAEMYATGTAGDLQYGRRFWADEYRMNARLSEFPKPTVSFLQGYTMGGGVGIGCHARLRIVGETAQLAMPECGIGLLPDVGGSMILARAPGKLGAYLGVTGARMGPADAILAGFADAYLPESAWDSAKSALKANPHANVTGAAAPPPGALSGLMPMINRHFAAASLRDLTQSLQQDNSDFARNTLKSMMRNAPLSMACTLEMLHRLGPAPTIRQALEMEYRFTHRAMQHGDFLEGIRAAIIDKDRNPKWRHAGLDCVPPSEVSAMLLPLGTDTWTFEEALQ